MSFDVWADQSNNQSLFFAVHIAELEKIKMLYTDSTQYLAVMAFMQYAIVNSSE